jgi:methylenetetrahydrofolate reductase (NADPH)
MVTPLAMPQLFRPDTRLTDVLQRGRFTVSAEVIPPRNGAEQTQVLEQVYRLVQAGAEFLSVTKGAGGSLRGGSLPIAQAIKERFERPAVAHFTCRDLNRGIRNVLALRGDPPDGQPEWKAREGGYSYAHELISQIRGMNEGRFLERAGGGPVAEVRERTDFCIGAAAYPEHPDEEERYRFFELKARAGADYGITDMLFDAEAYARFVDGLAKRGVHTPILPGTRLLKSRAQAERMMKKFRVQVPQSVLAQLPEREGPESIAVGLELFERLVERLRNYGAPGMHLFVIVDTEGACRAIERLRKTPSQERKAAPIS